MAYVGAFLFGAMLASAKSAKNFTTLRRRLYGRIARVDSRTVWQQPRGLSTLWSEGHGGDAFSSVRLADCRLPASQATAAPFCTAEQDAYRIKAERALNKCGDYGRWPAYQQPKRLSPHILHENDDPDDKRRQSRCRRKWFQGSQMQSVVLDKVARQTSVRTPAPLSETGIDNFKECKCCMQWNIRRSLHKMPFNIYSKKLM